MGRERKYSTVPAGKAWVLFGAVAVAVGGTGCGKQSRDTGDYMVVDLSAGHRAQSYPVLTKSEPPPGGWTDEHKTTKLVLRRIPEGSFVMGSPSDEYGRFCHEAQRKVRLRQAFYIGIFPVTQQQWYQVMGTWPGYFTRPDYRPARPVESVPYARIRGADVGPPVRNDTAEDTFLGRLCRRTGLHFDLPTEAQWEYAARAGVSTALHTGKNLANLHRCPNLTALARYGHDTVFDPGSDTSAGTATVGSYPANAWGLYDIHGNVWEWCRDSYEAHPGGGTDPAGTRFGHYRVMRGGSWVSLARDCRLAHRHSSPPAYAGSTDGFRVVLLP